MPTAKEIHLRGSYTIRSKNRTYDYEGFCFRADDWFVWRARVYRDGTLRGMLHGKLSEDELFEQGTNVSDAVTAAIVAAVENLREE